MKKFKTFDVWMNIILIAASLIWSFAGKDFSFIYSYFLVGGWQLISMIVHQNFGWFTGPGSNRSLYHVLVVIILILALAGVLWNGLLYAVMVIMLFASPFMAIIYAGMCYHETYVRMKRPLSILKN